MNINEYAWDSATHWTDNITSDGYVRRYFLYKKQTYFTKVEGYQYHINLSYPISEIQNSVENFTWKLSINNTTIGEFNIKNYLDNILSHNTITRHENFIDSPPFEAENEDFKIDILGDYVSRNGGKETSVFR